MSRVMGLLAAALVSVSVRAHADGPAACEVGAYRGPSGDFVTITERRDTATTGAWRYTFRNGRFGGTKDGPVQCTTDAVLIAEPGNGSPSKPQRWPRIALRTTPIRFESDGATLAGELIEPPATGSKPPLVVLVHGSENTASLRHLSTPYVLAAQGIAAFIYDKRGAGASGGKYTQSFAQLADDVVAASVAAKRLAKGRHGRFGLLGGSQGGWVAPRAANAAGAQFVAVGFGLVITPLEEDSEQVQSELRALGHGEAVLAKARKVTDATGAVVASHFTSGYELLAEVKKTYGAEPWFAKIKGEFTGDILAADETTLRREGRARFDNLDIDWRYDAIGELRKVKAPQLWIIAGEDREAPPAITIGRLDALRREGRPIEIAVFPATDHGMLEFVEAPDGARTPTRITDGYLSLLGDWIKQERHPPYGRAVFR